MTDDGSIRRRIAELIGTEHELRDGSSGMPDADALRAVETELDQCWDLLRQRDALRSAGKSPDEATPRSGSVVENYLS